MEFRSIGPISAERAAIIYEVSRQAVASAVHQSFEEALNTLAVQTRLAIGAHQAAISYVPMGDFSRAVHAVSLSDKYARYRSYDVMPTGEGIWSMVLRDKQAIVMKSSELPVHPRWRNFSNLKDARGLEHPPMRGWLAAPILRANGESLGIIHLSDKYDDAEFDHADLDLLLRLANMVLPTFELHFVNSQLHGLAEELRLSRDELDQRVQERTKELAEANSLLEERIRQSERENAERARMTEALRVSEQRFRELFENSPDAIFVEDFEGRVMDVNPSAARLHRCPREDLIGRHVSELVPPEMADQVIKDFQKLVRGESALIESVSQTFDGQRVPVEIRVSRIQFFSQPCLLLHVRDISDRKRAEENLRASEALFRSVVEGSLQGIMIHQDDQIRFVNPSYVRMFGYDSAEELIGRNLWEAVIAPDDRPMLRERTAAFYRGDLPTDNPVWRGIRKDGSTFWVTSSGSVIDWQGRPAIVSFVIDIDQRKRAEDANEATRRMLQLVLDHIPQGVFWKNRQSVYLGCNRVVARAFGFSDPQEIIGRNDYQLPGLSYDQAAFFIRKDREVMESNTARLGILEQATLADGRTIWMETNKVPLRDSAGNVVGILGTWEDVTEKRRIEEERQRLEAQLQHTQKLESLGILAGGIAHDFNNLLTSILGYADLAMQDLPRDSPAREHIASAIHGARRAAELTNQMLAYSGKGRFVVEPIDLSRLVADLSRLLEISISKKCVMKFHLASHLPSIEADAAQVRQVVMNLILNASEAIGDRSGYIAVTTGVMHCDREYLDKTLFNDNLPEGRYVFLEVADTGCGMSEEVQARIFDPFFTTKFTGRGLGLSAVMGIVRGHRGAIKLYSEVDKGTTFKVLFPAVDVPANTASHPAASASDWKGQGLVLVVDDEAAIRTLAQQMLKAMGFDVRAARDGPEALKILTEENCRVRLVLLDMTMPKWDGEETFREMRRVCPDIRAVLTSGYNEQTATSRFAGKGLAGFIQKPYGFTELRDVVRRVLKE